MYNFWEKQDWEIEDKHLKALKILPFNRKFNPLPKGPGLFVIRGPRQIGKSSWLKKMLLEANPKAAFYLSCENISEFKELHEVLKANLDRKILLIDEITFVDQWWRPIKSILDTHDDIRIVVTGSHAHDVKKGMDQMPGRWGNGGDFELLPMDYFEFSEMRKVAGWPRLEFDKELELYFRVGGFPTALAESGAEGKNPISSQEVYRRWLLGDILKLGKSETYLREILGQIALTTTSTISLQKIAQRTQIGSHNTAHDYIEILESCFALKTLYEIDLENNSPKFRKEKKFYFRDPLIYWMALAWAEITPPSNSSDMIAELVAHEYLVRKHKRFGFCSSKKGEIDFVSPKEWAIEVKWKDQPIGLSRMYLDFPLQNKKVWFKQNFLKP